MLPRLPRRFLHRPSQLAKNLAVAVLRNVGGLGLSFPLNSCKRGFSAFRTSPALLFCSCDPKNVHSTAVRVDWYRFKSSQPNPTAKTEDVEANEVVKEEAKETAEIDIRSESSLKTKSRQKSDLVIQRSEEEEEKSRRRYEKKDPPEEERHKYHKQRPDRAVNKALMRTDFFDNMKEKNKKGFAFALELFKEHDVHLRGHVEFIYSALKQMKYFGVHRDLDTYKKIIDVFPKGKMIQTNMFQQEFMHYPKHQQCAVDILEQMEDFGVIPDMETQQLLTNIFGTWSFPMRKASRMLYWMPKFKNLSPWLLPEVLPDNTMELAKLAVAQMTSIDLTAKITTYDCAELEDSYDLTWIVSGQSAEQQSLIEKLPSDRPIFVEGAFRVWLKRTCMNYFILRADPKVHVKKKSDPDDVGSLTSISDEEFVDKALAPVPTVHEQEDGVILALCCTGTSSRDSLVSWIRFLEQTNPRLGKDISVLFTLKSAIGPTDDLEILSYRDIDEIKNLGKPRDPFVTPEIAELTLDPGMPDLRQVGVWTESETKFPNWPHHFHKPDSVSMKNKLENEKQLEQLEEEEYRKNFRNKIDSLEKDTKQSVDDVKKIK